MPGPFTFKLRVPTRKGSWSGEERTAVSQGPGPTQTVVKPGCMWWSGQQRWRRAGGHSCLCVRSSLDLGDDVTTCPQGCCQDSETAHSPLSATHLTPGKAWGALTAPASRVGVASSFCREQSAGCRRADFPQGNRVTWPSPPLSLSLREPP